MNWKKNNTRFNNCCSFIPSPVPVFGVGVRVGGGGGVIYYAVIPQSLAEDLAPATRGSTQVHHVLHSCRRTRGRKH